MYQDRKIRIDQSSFWRRKLNFQFSFEEETHQKTFWQQQPIVLSSQSVSFCYACTKYVLVLDLSFRRKD